MFSTRALAFVTAGLLALFAGHGSAQPPKPPVVSDSLPIPSEKEAMKAKRGLALAPAPTARNAAKDKIVRSLKAKKK